MRRKLTITIDAEIHRASVRSWDDGRSAGFLNDLARPHVLRPEVADDYRAMAADKEREREASEWAEGVIGEVVDGPAAAAGNRV